MGKAHRDNHAARVKRGPEAFAKKAKRREPDSTCNLCGWTCRKNKLQAGLCPGLRRSRERVKRLRLRLEGLKASFVAE